MIAARTRPGQRRGAAAAALIAWGLLAACRSMTVARAEATGDVAWLEQNGSPDAVAALGRMGDRDPRAVAALRARSAYDADAFRAAWMASGRDAPWGAAMLRAGLADPKTADLAAAGMAERDPRLAAFVEPLEGALVRLSASRQNVNLARALASAGLPAHDAVVRRLDDPSTRDAMCRGIGSTDSGDDARAALYAAPQAARDAEGCVEAVVSLAQDDDGALSWLAERGEPGLLGAAGKTDVLSCPRLHVAWVKALGVRPESQYDALVVPLAYAVTRCPAEIDGILADSIVHAPAARGLVVEAIDPFARYDAPLRATCAALPIAARGAGTAVVRERASDALLHACAAPGVDLR